MRILFLLCFISSFALATRPFIKTHDVTVKKGDVYQGIQFPVGTIVTLMDETNSVIRVLLGDDFKMQNWEFKKGTALMLWPDGKVMEITPVAGQKLLSLTLEDGQVNFVRFSQQGHIEGFHVVKPLVVQKIKLKENSNVTFFPNGKMAIATAGADQSMNGIPMLDGSEFKLFQSGQLQAAKISKESKIKADVEPASVMPKEIWVKGDPNPANPSDIEFWPNGKLKRALLAKSVKIQNYVCGEGPVSFFESGNIQTLVLGEDKTVMLNPYEGQRPAEVFAKIGDNLNINEKGTVIGWGGKSGGRGR